MNENDDISGIFDDLRPSDFVRETSAVHSTAVAEDQNFRDFVDSCLDMLRFGFYAADGAPNPVALLLNSDGRRMFSPDDDETLGDYIGRLHREAKASGARGVFISILTSGGTYNSEGDNVTDSKEAVDQATKQGAMKPCLYWFAQRDDDIRHGIMSIDAGGHAAEVFEGPSDQASEVYLQILRG